MRFAMIREHERETACFVTSRGLIKIETFNEIKRTEWGTDIETLIAKGHLPQLVRWYKAGGRDVIDIMIKSIIPFDKVTYAPLLRRPPKIFGIGINYRDHASKMSAPIPSEIPGSFFKPQSTVIGHKDSIRIPSIAKTVTAEAELGIVMGKNCHNISEENWLDCVAGFTSVIDTTAEDIVKRNPRYLTLSKSFDTFFSFGPQLITPDEVRDISSLTVQTVINGEIKAENKVSEMIFSPSFLTSFHSKIFGWNEGDILSTGTPGAAEIRDGDIAECRITGFPTLENRAEK